MKTPHKGLVLNSRIWSIPPFWDMNGGPCEAYRSRIKRRGELTGYSDLNLHAWDTVLVGDAPDRLLEPDCGTYIEIDNCQFHGGFGAKVEPYYRR